MISFIDLAAQQNRIRPHLEKAMLGVLDHGTYIMGPEVYELEKQLSSFCGAKNTLSCSNGTDALALVLMAKGVKAGDAIFVPSFTFCATAEVVAWTGATPVFIDVLEDTFNMDPESLEKGIHKAKECGLRPCGVIPVDIFGQPSDYDSLNPIANAHGLWVMADGAQSFGATYKGQHVGTLAESTTTSFFPAKPLGCYGDGGAVFTDNEDLLTLMKSIRVHGQGSDKYQNIRVGMNGRLDTLQAAILIEKLAIFPEELKLRQHVADRYQAGLEECAVSPVVRKDCQSAWAQYTLKVDPLKRQELMEGLKKEGIPSVIYYPIPLHQQEAYKMYPCASDHLSITEKITQCVLSLPMHPYLKPENQDHIIKTFRDLVSRLQMKKVA